MKDSILAENSLSISQDRYSGFAFSPDIQEARKKILDTAREQVFLEMDDTDMSGNRRASEKATFYYISTGDLKKITEILKQTDVSDAPVNAGDSGEVKHGELSDTPKLQALGLFISGVTLCTRAAIDGGLPETIAYSLSDSYIRYSLNLTEPKKIMALLNSAIYDFTYEVHEYRYKNCSPLTRHCCEYILSHLHDKITLKSLSEYTGKNGTYISDTFYAELGIRPIEYIRKAKLSYARNTLEIADVSISTISDLLSFPSTSSFITYFKEEYGVTPMQYKKELHIS